GEARLEVDEAAFPARARAATRDGAVHGGGPAGHGDDVAARVRAADVGTRREHQVAAGRQVDGAAVAAERAASHRDDAADLEVAVEGAQRVRIRVAGVHADAAAGPVEIRRRVH